MAWAQYQISRVLLQVGAVEICDTQHLGGRVSEGREMELSSSERRSLHSTWGPPFGSHGGKESWLSFGAGAPFFFFVLWDALRVVLLCFVPIRLWPWVGGTWSILCLPPAEVWAGNLLASCFSLSRCENQVHDSSLEKIISEKDF